MSAVFRYLKMEGAPVSAYGASATGDATAAIMRAINANKGGLVIIDAGMVYQVAGLFLNDTSYNGTTIRCDGWLKLLPDGGAANFGGAWVGLLVGAADRITLQGLKFDGNRAGMTAREQIFCVGVAGASNADLGKLKFKEMRGDGLYVGQANWQASSATASNIEIDSIIAANSADDGRNAVTINSVSGLRLGYLYSNQVGGVIGAATEPGGIDIEPDQGYQSCTDILVGEANVITAGASGVGVFGKSASGNDANADWNCSRITFGKINLRRTGTSGAGLSGSGFTRCADLTIVDGTYTFNSTRGAGPMHDLSQRVKANWRVSNVTYGAWAGATGTLQDSRIEVTATNFSVAALRTTSTLQCDFPVKAAASAAGTVFAVQTLANGRGAITQTETHYTVDAPYDGNMARAFRNEPGDTVTYGQGTEVRGGDWTGYANPSVTIDATIPRRDVRGLLQTTAMPTSGAWAAGDFVQCVPANTGTAGKVLLGWVRLTTGTGQVAGTDWDNVYATTS